VTKDLEALKMLLYVTTGENSDGTVRGTFPSAVDAETLAWALRYVMQAVQDRCAFVEAYDDASEAVKKAMMGQDALYLRIHEAKRHMNGDT
jgi:hypothetical protein